MNAKTRSMKIISKYEKDSRALLANTTSLSLLSLFVLYFSNIRYKKKRIQFNHNYLLIES